MAAEVPVNVSVGVTVNPVPTVACENAPVCTNANLAAVLSVATAPDREPPVIVAVVVPSYTLLLTTEVPVTVNGALLMVPVIVEAAMVPAVIDQPGLGSKTSVGVTVTLMPVPALALAKVPLLTAPV